MVRIPAFHAGGPGSIPGVGVLRFYGVSIDCVLISASLSTKNVVSVAQSVSAFGC